MTGALLQIDGDSLHEIREELHLGLETAIEHGFKSPIFVSAIGANGTLLGARFREDDDNKWTCKVLQSVGEGLTSPINIMFVDMNTGNATRVLIDKRGATTFHWAVADTGEDSNKA
jgi:hypothetical protein